MIKEMIIEYDLKKAGLKINADNTLAVASTGTARTDNFTLEGKDTFGLELAFESEGAVDVVVWLEQGNTDLVGTERYTEHGDYVIPEGASAIINVTDELTHIMALPLVVARFGRIKCIGQGSNAASTALKKIKVVQI